MKRALYLGLGLLCVGLGVIGAFLPVMPTTVFMIIAAWAFAKSSSRLETWLLTHPRFGPSLVAWRENHVIPLPVKLMAWGSMSVSMILMFVGGAPIYAIAAAGALIAFGAIYIARCPSAPPPKE